VILENEESARKNLVIEALRSCGGNVTQAAKVLGVSRVTVWNRMKRYGIDLKRVIENHNSSPSSDF
jgi:two-component system response regulator HydG